MVNLNPTFSDGVFDVKKFHGDIPEIIRAMDLSPLGKETILRQKQMMEFWCAERENFFSRLWMNRDNLMSWKLEQLRKIVDWAYTTTPFYHELYTKYGYEIGSIRSLSDFEKLPTIKKEDVIKGFPIGLPSREHKLEDCRWMSSSGSSGKKTQIVLPQERANLDTMFKYRMFEFMAGKRLQENRWLYNIHFCPWWHTSILGKYPVFSIKQNCSPKELYRHLKILRPQIVSSLGSYLEELASLGRSLSDLGIEVVSTNSETTSHQERKRWSEIFQVPVLDEYSSEELDLLAMECPYRHYHVVEDDSHVELINVNSDNVGQIVGTDLWNTAMPIIRYEQEDLAEWNNDEEACQCGSHFRRIKNLHGRADQTFISLTGGKIHPGSLLDVVDHVLCADSSNIDQFRVIQETHTDIHLLLKKKCLSEDIPPNIIHDFKNKLSNLFKHPINIVSEIVPELPQEKSYKRRSLISRLT